MKKILLTCTAFAMAMASWAQVPKADVLDVVFNADGTATDVSELANEISVVGTPKIVTSDQFGMNVLCTASETIGGQNNNTFVIPMTEQIWSAIADGHTMECFVRPFWEGGLNKKGWSTLMGFQQSGGAGMLLYYGEWCYEPHIGGGYHDAWGGAPEFKQWAHVVGVMDGENNCTKIYVNGQLMQTLETSGTLGRPNVGSSPFIALAGDLSGSGVVEACFTGDMAIARMYSKALTDEEVQTLYNEIKSKDTGAEDHQEEGQFPNLRYDENGAVIIETAEDMHDFALLSKVAPYTNAEVVADIDYTGYNENISYYGSNAYAAVFNGNGHTITVNFDFSGTETTGFVADAVNGAVIKDLTLEGNVKADQRWCGILFGENYGATAQNITIRANLHSDYAGACYNGVLSGWDEKTCTYENIVIESTLSGTGTYMGGLIGDVAGTTYLKNVLVVTDANVDDKTQNSPLIAKPRSGANFDNVYFVNKG
ncbi:MAG: LamG-like jellyroll fold domain-containing protein, partial [Bacteroidaceae bacterium]|nr:LamG-like jellyroll fold domain-containing protein [Bacteroidaceae bacterium]